MYPVTLENIDGNCWTGQPACYGFMKKGMAGSNSLTMNNHFGYCGGLGQQIYPARAVPFNQLKYIWNSGTHCLNLGFRENPEYHYPVRTNVPRYLPHDNFDWSTWKSEYKDYVVKAATELGVTLPEGSDGQPWDYIDELLAIESYMDSESDSIIRRNSRNRQIFGVQVDNNCPADRALNYLMLARNFTTSSSNSKAYVWARYVKNLTPPQAAFFSRIVSCTSDWTGNPVWSFYANNGDSCIYPSYLLARGVGALYAEPTQVLWKQRTYSEMTDTYSAGHLRESTMPQLRVRDAHDGNVRSSLGSMLMAPFSHPVLCQWWESIPVAVLKRFGEPNVVTNAFSQFGSAVGGSHYSQLASSVMSYLGQENLNRKLREQNTTLGDVVIELLNTPFTQPVTNA